MGLTWKGSIDWNEEDWRERAACRHSGPDLFFPLGSTGLFLDDIEAAKAVCGRCHSQSPCLEFALATNQEAGVWGGTSVACCANAGWPTARPVPDQTTRTRRRRANTGGTSAWSTDRGSGLVRIG